MFDICAGRVNSTGTEIDVYVRMSRFNSAINMYEPFEQKLTFPEKPDQTALWSDVWEKAFIKEVECLIKGEGGLPLR